MVCPSLSGPLLARPACFSARSAGSACSRPVAEISIVQVGGAGHVNSCQSELRCRQRQRALSMRMDAHSYSPFGAGNTKTLARLKFFSAHALAPCSLAFQTKFPKTKKIRQLLSFTAENNNRREYQPDQRDSSNYRDVRRLGVCFICDCLQHSSFVQCAVYGPLLCAHALRHL